MAHANRPTNYNLYTSTVQVLASSSSEQGVSHNTTDATKLFVGNLSWNTTCDKLSQYFSMFGHVSDVNIIRHPITKCSKGYGFVTFTEISSLENVLKASLHVLDGRKIDPKRAIPKNRPKKVKLFVGGLNQNTSANDIVEYFGRYGKVQDIMMPVDQHSGRHRGFVFITFENDNVVESVCAFDCHTINQKRVECKRTAPRRTVQSNAPALQQFSLSNSQRMETPPVINPSFINQQSSRTRLPPISQPRTVTGHSRLPGRRRPANYRYVPYNHRAAVPVVTTATTTSTTTTTSRTTITPSIAAAASQIASSNAANFYLEYDSEN